MGYLATNSPCSDEQRAATSALLLPTTLTRKQRSRKNNSTGKSQQKRATRKPRGKRNEISNNNNEKNPTDTKEDDATDQDTDRSNVSRCRAKRAEMRFKRNILNAHDSLRSLDCASESNMETTAWVLFGP